MGVRLPDFLIIGAMKCGTSSLHEQLARRPRFYMSDPKEPNFFSDEDRWSRGLDWYASLFAGARPDQLCGESSTHYTKLPTYPHASERLWRHLPRAKLVYVMRDPVERIVSQYIHEWSRREVSESLDAAVRRNERFVAYSCYARQLEPYLDRFGADSILPVAFERLLEHPDEELGRICQFLGDPTPARWLLEVGAQNASSQRVRRSALRDVTNSLPLLATMKSRLPSAWREALKAPWRMRGRPGLDSVLRGELEAHLDDDLERLGRWLGIELTCRTWRAQALESPLRWAAPPSRAA